MRRLTTPTAAPWCRGFVLVKLIDEEELKDA